MRIPFRRALAVLLLCLWAHHGYAQTGLPIQKIEIKNIGPPAASDPLVRANIRVKEGDTYLKTSVDDDVRNLYATGYFYNIRVAIDNAENGIKLTYVLQGKPTLSEIRFDGNKKYSRKKLLKSVTSKVGEPLDERKLFTDSQEITKKYQKSGYPQTTVKYVPSIEENAGRATVTFEIHETPKVKINDVVFVDAQAFSQKKLRKVIKTRRRWMFSWITGSGVLKDEQFEEDKDKLAEFYRNEGYIDYELKDVQFDYLNPKRMNVRLFVNEGTRYHVGSIDFKGNTAFSTNEILQGITVEGKREKPTMLPGKIFTPKGLAHDTEAIQDFYGSKGYIDTNVRPLKVPNTEKGTIDLVNQISNEDKGKSFVEKIEIKGNTKTKDKVIRRELAISPGETFDMVRVKLSKSRLEQMQYFDKVEANPVDTTVPNRKDLVIDVEEGSTGHVEIGAGFSSIDSLFGFVGYREGNFDLFNPPYFRGGGQKLRIGTTIGLERKDFTISFTEPWFLGRRVALGVDLYYSQLNYLSSLYDINQGGGRVSLTKQLPHNFVASVSYTLENINIYNVAPSAPQVIKDEPPNQLVSKVGGSIAYDTRNSVIEPNHGQRTEFLAEFAGGPLGAEVDFYKWEFRSRWYFPGFMAGHIIEVAGRVGVVESYGRTPMVPLFDRYFLGGPESLRGFKYRQVSPRNPPSDEPVGGDTLYYGTIEYSIPIIERLRVAFFYDIGNVLADPYDFNFSSFSDDWGIGIRLNIPHLGPLRLDYGIPIHHDQYNSGSGKFQFSAGFVRDF